MSGVVEILAELIAFDSVSHHSNLPISDWLVERLRQRGFAIHLHRYRDARSVEKQNLVALAGPTGARLGEGGLALVGHTDTVPYDPAWTEALRLTERDGRLYGRGTADTKGFIAAVLAAVERIDLEQLVHPLALVFTADEEVGCIGAQRLLGEVELRPAHAIVGEPTRLVPIRAHKGYCLAEVEVRGIEGHSAFPSVGRSAILDAARLLGRIEGIQRELQEESDPAFDPPWVSLNVGTIAGGKAPNVIAGRCAFPLEWRPLPGTAPERVPELLRREIEALRSADPGFDAGFVVKRSDPAVAVPEDAPIIRFLEAATGHRSATVPFGTELPYFHGVGALGCICGPGDIRVAHRTGEYVERAELERAVGIYAAAIERFCRETASA